MTTAIDQPQSVPTRGTTTAMATIICIALFSFASLWDVRHATANSIVLAIVLFFPIMTGLMIFLFFEIRKRPYSIHLMHLISLLLFVGLSPMFQVVRGEFPLVMKSQIVVKNVILANLACLFWLLSYCSAYYLTERKASQESKIFDRILRAPVSLGGASLMLALVPVALGWLWVVGLGGTATRDAAEAALNRVEGPLQLVTQTFVRGFPFVALTTAIAVLRSQSNWILVLPLAALCLGVLYIDNPLAAPRYWTVAIALGCLAPLLLDRRKTGSALLLVSIAGLVIMPALDLGRRAWSVEDVLFEFRYFEFPSPSTYLAENGDLASYSIFTLALEWVSIHGLTWGRQLLGAVILFWVPRSVWADKPISTGSQIVGDFGFDFTVLSAAIMADAYLDFGWVGVVGLAALVGWAVARLDRVYWSRSGTARVIDSFYPYLLGMMLFITRGSLMSAFPYALSFIGCAVPLAILGAFGVLARRSQSTSVEVAR